MAIRFCKVKRNKVNMELGIKLDSDFFRKAKSDYRLCQNKKSK